MTYFALDSSNLSASVLLSGYCCFCVCRWSTIHMHFTVLMAALYVFTSTANIQENIGFQCFYGMNDIKLWRDRRHIKCWMILDCTDTYSIFENRIKESKYPLWWLAYHLLKNWWSKKIHFENIFDLIYDRNNLLVCILWLKSKAFACV